MARDPADGFDGTRALEMAVGALNGLVGDYLHRTKNGLATEMEIVRWAAPAAPSEAADATPAVRVGEGRLPVTREGLAEALAGARLSPRIAVFVHGLMSTEDIWRGAPGESYGELLARDLGVASFEVRFNSGLRISQNGEHLDALMEQLVSNFPVPVEEVAMIGHSLGGLVIRAAHHAASERGSSWLGLCRRAFYLGSPHLGAPLERFGNVLTWALKKIPNPITELIADIVNLRSAGVKDLRYGNLRREDWEGADADALLQNLRHPVPLSPNVRHHLVVGSLSRDLESAVLFGDMLVPVRSAAGRAVAADRSPVFPAEHVAVFPGFHHLRLAHDPEVYTRLRAWAEEPLR
ncbi:MAG: alpha/beta hydrolase [Polyangiaceae bacterium]